MPGPFEVVTVTDAGRVGTDFNTGAEAKAFADQQTAAGVNVENIYNRETGNPATGEELDGSFDSGDPASADDAAPPFGGDDTGADTSTEGEAADPTDQPGSAADQQAADQLDQQANPGVALAGAPDPGTLADQPAPVADQPAADVAADPNQPGQPA